MTAFSVTPRVLALQYDGTNRDEVQAAVSTNEYWKLSVPASAPDNPEDALVWDGVEGNRFYLPLNNYLIYGQYALRSVTPEEFADQFVVLD